MNRLSLILLAIVVTVIAGGLVFLVIDYPRVSTPAPEPSPPPTGQPTSVEFSPASGEYTISYNPLEWGAKYQSASEVIFAHPDVGAQTPADLARLPGFAIWTETITDTPGVADQAAWLKSRGLTADSGQVVSQTQPVINGLTFYRFVVRGREGFEKELFVYFPTADRAITFGAYPYDPTSADTTSAEAVLATLKH